VGYHAVGTDDTVSTEGNAREDDCSITKEGTVADANRALGKEPLLGQWSSNWGNAMPVIGDVHMLAKQAPLSDFDDVYTGDASVATYLCATANSEARSITMLVVPRVGGEPGVSSDDHAIPKRDVLASLNLAGAPHNDVATSCDASRRTEEH
jgi:hypothetical protein